MPEGKMRDPTVWGTFDKTKVPRASKARKLTPRLARQLQKTRHLNQTPIKRQKLARALSKCTIRSHQIFAHKSIPNRP